jgi:hypothetical protein
MREHTLILGLTCLIVLALGAACQVSTTPTSIESPSPPENPSLTILETVTSRQVSGDYAPIDVTSQFSPTDSFYCVIQVADVESKTQIVARWRFGNTVISETIYTTEEQGSGYVAFELTSDQPWPEGVYQVEILSGGAVMDSVEFRVAKGTTD